MAECNDDAGQHSRQTSSLGSDLAVAGFLALIAVAVGVSIAAERVRVPAAVLLVIVGVAAAALLKLRPPFDFAPTVLFVFLPPLVFEAAWSLDLRALRAESGRVVLLAVPGTIFSALAVAFVVTGIGALPFAPAFVLGAIVAATDPVAVVAAFRRVDVPAGLRTLVEAESLCNDGIAIVLYGAAIGLAVGGTVALGPEIAHGALAVSGGLLGGALCALPVWLALRASTAPEFEVTATVVLAYGAYLLADRLQLSGIFATAAAAVALRALLARREHLSNRDDVDVFWRVGALIANAIVFLSTGLSIDFAQLRDAPLLVSGVIAALAVSRIVLVGLVVRDNADRIAAFLAGMRGALPLALALALPRNLPHRAAILVGVFATVLVTLVLQGVPLEGVVGRLYGRRSEGEA